MNTDDLSHSFQTPEFLETLANYEEMVRQHRTCYFESNDLILLAEYYAAQQKIKESDDVIKYALTIHPDNLELQIYQCNSLIASGKLDEAEQLLNKLPDQQDEEVIYARVNICLERGQEEKTDSLLIPLMESEDYELDMMVDIINLFLDANNETYALKWLDLLFEHYDKSEPLVLEIASDFYMTFRHFPEAINTYNQLLDIDPYQQGYWLNLTRAYLANGQTEQAFNAIDFALAIDESNSKALELKGYCYLQSLNAEEALKYFERALPNCEDPVSLYQIMEKCCDTLGNDEQSIVYLNKMLEDPTCSDFEKAVCYQKLANHYLLLSEYDNCLKCTLKGLEYDNGFAPLYVMLGEYYLFEDNQHAAEQEFAHAEAYATDKKEIEEQIFRAYFRACYFQEALNYFQQLEEKYPLKMDRYYFCVAYCCYAIHDETNLMKYLVRGNTLLQQFQDGHERLQIPDMMPEAEDFMKLANEILCRIEEGSIHPEDYFDLPEQPLS